MKILAFAGSGSSRSINQQFVTAVATLFKLDQTTVLDISELNIPLFTEDEERLNGIPEAVLSFQKQIEEASLILISFAEHNGSYTAFFKNLFDWLSRNKGRFLEGKKVFLLSTSSGARGGASVLQAAIERFPRHGAEVVDSFSFPSFDENFDRENLTISNRELLQILEEKIQNIKQS
jgi:chromate reductase, NAD(P)H dehydrogenase (quinone)